MGSRGSGTSFVSLQRRGKVDDPSWNRAKMLEEKKKGKIKKRREGVNKVRNKRGKKKIGNAAIVTRSRHVYAYKI